MKITLPSGNYILNCELAIKTGALVREKRPIVFEDLKIGDVFKMVSNQPYLANAIFRFVGGTDLKNTVAVANWSIRTVWFGKDGGQTKFLVLQNDGTWKDSI